MCAAHQAFRAGCEQPIMGLVVDSREVLSRRAAPPDVVVRYGDRADQICDLRLPPATGAPLVVLLHGGFWRAAWDRTHLRPMADALVGAGHAVAMPEYARTGDGGGWPATFEDVSRAVAAVPELATEAVRGAVDPAKVVLAGHSAGGQLALWCAGRGLPAAHGGVVALAPVADLAEAFRLDLDGGAVLELMGGGPDQVPDRYERADPCQLPAPSTPVVLVHGRADAYVPVDLSRRYAAHSRAELHLLDGVGHFDLIDPLSAAWPTVLEAITDLSGRPG